MAYKRISPVPVNEGGTGALTLTGVLTGNGTSAFSANTITQYGTVVAGASNAVASVAPSATSGIPLVSNGTSANPSYSTAVVAGGGTGNSTLTTAYGVLCAGTTATGAIQTISSLGSSGQVLTSQGVSSLPQWTTISGGVPSIAGTSNQIVESGSPSATTLSISSTFIAPGSIESTSTMTVDTGLYLKRTTSSTIGVLYGQNVNNSGVVQNLPIMHFYGVPGGGSDSNNTFVGPGAGNFTLTQNTARSNTALGDATPADGTNHLLGILAKLTTGAYNTMVGSGTTGAYVTSGNGNSFFGAYTGGTVTTGNDNLLLGAGIDVETGSAYTNAESNNILLCNAGVVGESNVLRIGTYGTSAGQQNKSFIAATYSNYGTNNTFVGSSVANTSLTTGSATGNVAIGTSSAFGGVTTAANCVVVGDGAGAIISTGSSNVVVGAGSLPLVTTGQHNTVLGSFVFQNMTTSATRNLGLGFSSGGNYTGTESDNILLNSPGVTSEANALHIGGGTGTGPYDLNSAFICGIQGITVTGSAVLVSSSDQLGVAVSSARYKDNIDDMGSYSSAILSLRPVTFIYKSDPEEVRQTGLIAEEVAALMPGLVIYDKQGLAQTVKYHELPALLLNELQKALKRIDELEEKVGA